MPTAALVLALLLVSTLSAAPDSFSWDNHNSTSFVPPVRSQNMPAACSSGWALSAVDVLNARIKIRRNAATPDLQLSAQVLLSCDESNFGCMGGQPLAAYRWVKRNNLTDSSCQTYLAKGYTNGYGCSSQVKCQNCDGGQCKATPNSKIYAIQDYGSVAGQQAIIQEILTYGPIACGIDATNLVNYTGGVVKGAAGGRVNHYVLVYGWGVDNGTKFWRVKNSWGSAWGEKGHFRVERGANVLGIEGRCAWASPVDTWTNDVRNKTLPNDNSIRLSSVKQPIKMSYQLPAYLTPSRSAVTPQPCSSSWAFATVQMIADRESKSSNGRNQTILSVQALLNCGVGKCSKGGSPIQALVFIEKYGLPDESCQNYIAADPSKEACVGVANCGSCSGTVFDYKCYETKNYKRWKISNYSFFSGAQNMKNQLYQGPIVCGIYASEAFKKYKGGIFSEVSVSPSIDSYVELIGYGNEDGKDYWLGRNFYGTAWGQSGFFRIQMGSNNLGIENKCYYAKGLF